MLSKKGAPLYSWNNLITKLHQSQLQICCEKYIFYNKLQVSAKYGSRQAS